MMSSLVLFPFSSSYHNNDFNVYKSLYYQILQVYSDSVNE